MPRTREGRPKLSRDLIVATGLDLARANEEPTLGAVARRLGVHVTSLYDHVADRADLVNALREAGASELPFDDLPTAWDPLLRTLATGMGHLFATFPGAIVPFAVTPLPESSGGGPFEALVVALEQDGVPPEVAEAGVHALTALSLGLALDSLDPEIAPAETEAARRVGVDGLVAALRAAAQPR